MKELSYLLKRYYIVCKSHFEYLILLNVIVFATEYVISTVGPGFILKMIIEKKGLNTILIILFIYSFAGIFKNFIMKELGKRAFLFRIREITNIEKLALKTSSNEIEQNSGGKRIMNALDAVCSGNEYGIEKYLLSCVDTITLSVTILLFMAMMEKLPAWVIVVLFLSLIVCIPYEKKFREKEEKKINEIYVHRQNLENFRRTMLREDFGKDIRLYNCLEYIKNVLWQKCIPIFDDTVYIEIAKKERTRFHEIFSFVRNLIILTFLIFNLQEYSASMIVIYLGILVGFDGLIEQLLSSITAMSVNKKSVGDYIDLIKKNNIINKESKETIKANIASENAILFEKVKFAYEGKTIYKNLSFSIKKGEKVAIIGENGVGKTTLIKLLLGDLKPDQGTIYIDDKKQDKYEKEEYLKLFSIVPQNSELCAFTLYENVTCVPINLKEQIDNQYLQNIICDVQLEQAIKATPSGLDSYCLNEYEKDGIMFSKGQLQRIFMARALYKDAPILLLDEPTAALDAKAEGKLYKLYTKLAEKKTCLFVSHRLGSTTFCNKILFIEDDDTYSMGTFEELYSTNKKFKNMYDTQKSYYEGTI